MSHRSMSISSAAGVSVLLAGLLFASAGLAQNKPAGAFAQPKSNAGSVLVTPNPALTQKAAPHPAVLLESKQCFWKDTSGAAPFGTSGFCPADRSANVGDPCSCPGPKAGTIVAVPAGDGTPSAIN